MSCSYQVSHCCPQISGDVEAPVLLMKFDKTFQGAVAVVAFALREVGHTAEVVFHSLSGEYFIIGDERIVY